MQPNDLIAVETLHDRERVGLSIQTVEKKIHAVGGKPHRVDGATRVGTALRTRKFRFLQNSARSW